MTTRERMTTAIRAANSSPAVSRWRWVATAIGVGLFVWLQKQPGGNERWEYAVLAVAVLINPIAAQGIGASIGFIAGPALAAWRQYRKNGNGGANDTLSGGASRRSEPK